VKLFGGTVDGWGEVSGICWVKYKNMPINGNNLNVSHIEQFRLGAFA